MKITIQEGGETFPQVETTDVNVLGVGKHCKFTSEENKTLCPFLYIRGGTPDLSQLLL